MIVLLSNDDGIDAPGLAAMRAALSAVPRCRVVTVAPSCQQSAAGHAVTLGTPLRLTQTDEDTYHVNGTPADSVLLGLKVLFRRKPDLVVSGVNLGQNLGEDVYYSGTVAAAREGAINGVPSMAVSVAGTDGRGFVAAARFATGLAARLHNARVPADTLLNVNVPDSADGDARGALVTRPGSRTYRNVIHPQDDPRGGTCYRVAGSPVWKRERGTDYAAVSGGRVSVTPLAVAPATLRDNALLTKIITD